MKYAVYFGSAQVAPLYPLRGRGGTCGRPEMKVKRSKGYHVGATLAVAQWASAQNRAGASPAPTIGDIVDDYEE